MASKLAFGGSQMAAQPSNAEAVPLARIQTSGKARQSDLKSEKKLSSWSYCHPDNK